MKVQNRPVYRCEHCPKYYLVERFAIKHENECSKNPANYRKCFDCEYLKKQETEIDDDYGESHGLVNVFYCKKIHSYLYPPKVEIKKNAYDFGEDSNEPMKTECEHFKSCLL